MVTFQCKLPQNNILLPYPTDQEILLFNRILYFESLLYLKLSYVPFHYIFNLSTKIPCPSSPEYMQHMVMIPSRWEKEEFTLFSDPFTFLHDAQVQWREVEGVRRNCWDVFSSVYSFMQQKHCHHLFPVSHPQWQSIIAWKKPILCNQDHMHLRIIRTKKD